MVAFDVRKDWKNVIRDWNSFRSMPYLSKWGRILLIAGLLVAGYFLFAYDTTGGSSIHNLALLQNRTLGSIAGMIMAAVGAIMIVIDAKTR